MQELSSTANPIIKEAAALLSSAGRKKAGKFIIEGARLCADAAENGAEIETLFISSSAALRYSREFDILSSAAKRAYFISEAAAGKLSDTKNSQQIFAVCRKKERKFDLLSNGFYVLTENIQNPDNLGAVSRTAEALGADGMAVTGGCDIFSPKALRASMGALLRFPVMRCESAAEFIEMCKSRSVKVYCTSPDAGGTDIRSLNKCGGAAVVIGNEGAGVTPETAAESDGLIRIPMLGRAESLNAAAAAAITMWEFMKDR